MKSSSILAAALAVACTTAVAWQSAVGEDYYDRGPHHKPRYVPVSRRPGREPGRIDPRDAHPAPPRTMRSAPRTQRPISAAGQHCESCGTTHQPGQHGRTSRKESLHKRSLRSAHLRRGRDHAVSAYFQEPMPEAQEDPFDLLQPEPDPLSEPDPTADPFPTDDLFPEPDPGVDPGLPDAMDDGLRSEPQELPPPRSESRPAQPQPRGGEYPRFDSEYYGDDFYGPAPHDYHYDYLDTLDPWGYHGCDSCGGRGCGHCRPPGRWFIRGEYMIGWIRGVDLPPLVTSAPIGTPLEDAGVLGEDSTISVLGPRRILDQEREGGRIAFGYWFGPCETWGVAADYFGLNSQGTRYATSSEGSPILARPFYDVDAQEQNREIVAYPDVIAGGILALTQNEFQSSGVWFTHSLKGLLPYFNRCGHGCGHGCGGNACGNPCGPHCWHGRFDLLGGYRFYRYDESLQITQFSNILDAPALGIPAANGTTFLANDVFATENEFHGGEIGFAYSSDHGPWTVDLLGRFALGNNRQRIVVDGSTIVTVPGTPPVTAINQGGFLALPSNMARIERDKFAFIPELGVTLGYRLGCHVKATVGYTLIYWNDVVRGVELVDTNINPTQTFLGGPFTGTPAPQLRLVESNLWVQAVRLGLEVTW